MKTASNNRKAGRRKASYDDESTEKVLKTAKQMKRTDWAGKGTASDVRRHILSKLRQNGAVSNFRKADLEAIRLLCESQVNGVGRRMFPRIDEVIKRIQSGAV